MQLLDRRRMGGIVSNLSAGGQNSLLSALTYRGVNGLVACDPSNAAHVSCAPFLWEQRSSGLQRICSELGGKPEQIAGSLRSPIAASMAWWPATLQMLRTSCTLPVSWFNEAQARIVSNLSSGGQNSLLSALTYGIVSGLVACDPLIAAHVSCAPFCCLTGVQAALCLL